MECLRRNVESSAKCGNQGDGEAVFIQSIVITDPQIACTAVNMRSIVMFVEILAFASRKLRKIIHLCPLHVFLFHFERAKRLVIIIAGPS